MWQFYTGNILKVRVFPIRIDQKNVKKIGAIAEYSSHSLVIQKTALTRTNNPNPNVP